MRRYTYDGTMAGLLSAVFRVFEDRQEDGVLVKADDGADLFSVAQLVDTDAVKARRVWKGLAAKAGKEGQEQFYQCFLSEEAGIENVLLHYARYVFSGAEKPTENFGHPAVLAVTQTARRVWREKHRMEAFVRFKQLQDGLYYAAIDPDFNVLPIILPHFKSRYADQRWLIYDLQRGYGIYYDSATKQAGEVQLQAAEGVDPAKPEAGLLEEGETNFQRLWKDYFHSTGIAARRNPALHLRHIPRRYWRYLTEKEL